VRVRHKAIYEELRSFESAKNDPHYGRRVADSLRAELQTLWYTGEIFVQRPAVQEELRNALPYLSETFPEVVIRLDRSPRTRVGRCRLEYRKPSQRERLSKTPLF
jgi:phosphoenolpyruvate carboxylase